jgi:hypothetical protein
MNADVRVHIEELSAIVIQGAVEIAVLPEEALDIECTVICNLRLSCESQRAYTNGQ